ncbi:Gag-pol Polyprotein [Phytophthora palmivora]|uniref:Gag-pol Polyprotein n=1 Tax=Phytophthora palmivora TaxID=4796 RepID=A0A2P4Y9F6_9STRA|nr:Gag-pol Polyprotein [Phytophthora palmivora]
MKSPKPNVKLVYEANQWISDNGANRHLVGDKRYFVNYHKLTPEERENATVYGYNGERSPIGIGAIDLWVSVDGEPVVLRGDQVYYSPKKTNLFSQSVATEQGFQTAYDDSTREYTLSMNGAVVIKVNIQPCKLWIFKAENTFLLEKSVKTEALAPATMINYAISDGVANLQCWHERLGHICPQFVKLMADQSLVDGMMIRNRTFNLCETCQLGKQKAKTTPRNLDRGVKRRNQLVCADLLFPPLHYNCIRFKAILLIMDVHTRFLTAYPVQTKHKDVINPLINRYVAWAEQHWPECKVQEVLTDGGGEFVNGSITTWYQLNGITHTLTPPNTSRLSIVKRTHQTLTGMMKDSGFPTSFWVDALYYAVYIKNRVFSSPINCTPYEEMWGRKPGIHHVRKFGAFGYVHTKVGPSRHKFDDNRRIGYVLGYRDDLLGCKVYFPSEGAVQVASHVTFETGSQLNILV